MRIKKTVLPFLGLLLAAVQLPAQDHIDYEMFGAAGDGVTDDLECIARAHAAANAKGLPVRVNSSKTYYIGGGSTEVVVQTDTDFGDAHFIIDDRAVADITKAVFVIKTARPCFEVACKPLKKTDRRLRCGRLPGECVVEVLNEEKRVYIRKGLNRNAGTPLQEVLLVGRNGKILCPVKWNYEKITSAKVYPVDKGTLTVKGGVFTTIANQDKSEYTYYSRGILVERSNVVLDGLTHYVEGEIDHGAPYRGFLVISISSGVCVQNCLLTAHKTYRTIGSAGKPVDMGSYDLSAGKAINTSIRNCRQTTEIDNKAYWGLMGSNFCKGMTLENCRFSRFDAHQGVMNVTLLNSVFGHMGVRAVGSGTMRIENCEIRLWNLFALRDDYGSTWDGDVVVKNCILAPQGGSRVRIISGSNNGDHNFGYPCMLPHNVIIDGLVVDDTKIESPDYTGPFVFNKFKQVENAPYPLERKGVVTIRGLKVTSGKEIRISEDPAGFTGYRMDLQ